MDLCSPTGSVQSHWVCAVLLRVPAPGRPAAPPGLGREAGEELDTQQRQEASAQPGAHHGLRQGRCSDRFALCVIQTAQIKAFVTDCRSPEDAP